MLDEFVNHEQMGDVRREQWSEEMQTWREEEQMETEEKSVEENPGRI